MKESRTVEIRNTKFKMYRVASTGWVFVSTKRNGSFSVGQEFDGVIAQIDQDEAIGDATNRELMHAWVVA